MQPEEKTLAELETRLREIREKLQNKKINTKTVVALWLTVLAYIFFSFIALDKLDSLDLKTISLILVVSGPFTVIVAIGGKSFLIIKRHLEEKNILNEIGMLKSEKLQAEIQQDFFNNLIKINFKYIDKYYLQTQIQANKSFILAVICSSVAFVIIIAGIILMKHNKETAYVATSAGVLSEFVAAVFFYLYNKTIIKMGEYHHKLVLTQNVSLALKISEQMPAAEKAVAQAKLMDELAKDVNKFIATQV